MKSESAILIKSFVRGASPPTRPLGSYLWTIFSICVNCALHSSDAALYFEFNINSSYPPAFNSLKISSGIISWLIAGPIYFSSPITELTPSTFSSSLIIEVTWFGSNLSLINMKSVLSIL